MVYKVLVVDDSNFFQVRLAEVINEHPELSVCGVAGNGQEAIEQAEKLKPDVISMDYEMPYLDGVSAVKAIMNKRPVPIIMFSSLTYEGARITLDALEAGAVDFIPKNFAEVSRSSASLKKKLHDTLLMFARKADGAAPKPSGPPIVPQSAAGTSSTISKSPTAPRQAPAPSAQVSSLAADPLVQAPVQKQNLKNKVKLLIIGSSTGGPVALTEVLQKLPADFPLPIVVVQHMPENFTKALAERLNRHCRIRVFEAKDGDELEAGKALIAPGGHQLMFDRRGKVKVIPGDERVNYKPSVDIAFASGSNVYRNAVLGVVLTGMGADGCEGARLLKEQGAFIWSQDQASCVVYGMPKAVANAGLTDTVLPLDKIGDRLAQEFS